MHGIYEHGILKKLATKVSLIGPVVKSSGVRQSDLEAPITPRPLRECGKYVVGAVTG